MASLKARSPGPGGVSEPAKPEQPNELRRLAVETVGRAWAVGRLEDAGRLLDQVARAEYAGDYSSMVARDPRAVGVKGGYPQVNEGLRGQGALLEFARTAYRRTALARVLVDRVASDQWGEWFTLEGGSDSFREAVEAFMRNPTGKVGGKPLWWWFKRAQRLARRDGRALLYLGLRESGEVDPQQPPGNVQGVRYLHVVQEHQIEGVEVDTDIDSESFTDVKAWLIRIQTAGGQGKTLKVHPDRVLPFIPSPTEDDLAKGDSILVQNVNYIEGVENMLWSALEAYFTEASPYIIIYRQMNADGTPATPMSPEQKAEVKREIGKLQQAVTQRVFVHGVKVEVLQGSGQLANPTPHWDIAVDAAAMAIGMPKSIMKGDSAGELASAREDSRRWAGMVSKIQEEENDPLASVLLSRLADWDVESWAPKTIDNQVTIKWNPIYEEDAKGEAERQEVLMRARTGYTSKGLPPPIELEWEPTAEAFIVAAANKPPPQPFGFGGGPAIEASDVPPRLAPILERFRRRVERVLRAHVAKAAASVTEAQEPDAALRAVGFRDELMEAILQGLLESANEGNLSVLQNLDAEDYHRLIDDGRYPVFKSIASELADDVGRRLADDVRGIVADGLAKGTAPRGIRDAIMVRAGATAVDAERIARTEAMKGYSRGAVEAMRSVGVQSVTWRAFPDADQDCLDLDGKEMSLDEFTGIFPVHPNDRCVPIATGPGINLAVEQVTTSVGVLMVPRRM